MNVLYLQMKKMNYTHSFFCFYLIVQPIVYVHIQKL